MVVNSPGLIDAGYRGEVRVSLYNSGSEPFVVGVGERIAQLVIQRVEEPAFVAAEVLPDTVEGRGRLRQQRTVGNERLLGSTRAPGRPLCPEVRFGLQ